MSPGSIICSYEKARKPEFWRNGKVIEGPFVLFRSDMDALPVFEETDAPFKSAHEGFMHAHAAMMFI